MNSVSIHKRWFYLPMRLASALLREAGDTILHNFQNATVTYRIDEHD